MSKTSQREAREKNEQQETQRRSKIFETVHAYLRGFAEMYRMEISAEAAEMYVSALQHLSPSNLKIACDEAVKQCKFFPNPAEILDALKTYQDRQPMYAGYVPPPREPDKPLNPEFKKIWDEAWNQIRAKGPEPWKHRTIWKYGDTWEKCPGVWKEIEGTDYMELEPGTCQCLANLCAKTPEKTSTVQPAYSGPSYVPMVGNQTLREWALDQDLNDTLPRTQYEIEYIKAIKNYGKPKHKRQKA
jgi:hypothetical protein